MPLFLVTCLYNDGIDPDSFVVVEAATRAEVAQHMQTHPSQWQNFLRRSVPYNNPTSSVAYQGHLLDWITAQPDLTPDQLLELIDRTTLDGDSQAQLRIFELQPTPLSGVETEGWKRRQPGRGGVDDK